MPDDYATSEFDFAEMLEFVFTLQSNASATKFVQSAFGVSSNQARSLVAEIGKLDSGHGFVESLTGAASGGREEVSELALRQFWRGGRAV